MASTYVLGPYLVTDLPPTDGLYSFVDISWPLAEDPSNDGLYIMSFPFTEIQGLITLDPWVAPPVAGEDMNGPILRGMSPMSSTTARTLTIPLPSRNEDDLIFLYSQSYNAAGTADGSIPNVPAGYRMLQYTSDANGFDLVAWRRAKANEPDPVLTLNSGQPSGMPWWGNVEVYGNVDYRDPGWLAVPGTAGNYATVTRTALSTATSLTVMARASFNALGVANWVFGWANGDVGFGLNATNQPVIYATNTVGGVIGNAPPTDPIDGLTASRRIWLQGTVDTTTAECTYAYSFDDVENWESVHWQGLGAPVVGTNAGTTMRMTNSGTAFIGTLSAAGTPTGKNVNAVAEFTDVDPGVDFQLSEPDPPGFALVGTAKVYRPTTGDSSPIEDWAREATPPLPQPIATQTRYVYGPDRWVMTVFTASSTVKQTAFPIAGPDTWTKYQDRFANFASLYLKNITRSIVADDIVDLTDASPSSEAYNYGYYGYVIRPLPAPFIPPTSPQPQRLVLGCPQTYTTWITDGTYKRTIEQLRWSNISWERVLDQISSATVTIPDEYGGVKCLARAGGLMPWRYGLLIERNDQEVWSGPIITVARKGNEIQLAASDVLARYQRRFGVRDSVVDYENRDAGEIFRDIIATHAASSSDLWELPVPLVDVNVAVTRSLRPREFKYAWDLLSELLSSAIDAYVMNGRLYVWEPMKGWQYQDGIKRTLDGTYNSDFDFVYGTFTEESFSVRPDWTLDGTGQANFVVVPSTDTGEYGFRTYSSVDVPESEDLYGVLDFVDPDAVEVPTDALPQLINQLLNARAQSVAALRGYAPITIEGGTLSQNAPVDVDNLRPGSLWKMDVFDKGFGQLLSLIRLRRVSVTVTRTAAGVEEKINPVIEPVGWQGAF